MREMFALRTRETIANSTEMTIELTITEIRRAIISGKEIGQPAMRVRFSLAVTSVLTISKAARITNQVATTIITIEMIAAIIVVVTNKVATNDIGEKLKIPIIIIIISIDMVGEIIGTIATISSTTKTMEVIREKTTTIKEGITAIIRTREDEIE